MKRCFALIDVLYKGFDTALVVKDIANFFFASQILEGNADSLVQKCLLPQSGKQYVEKRRSSPFPVMKDIILRRYILSE